MLIHLKLLRKQKTWLNRQNRDELNVLNDTSTS